MWTLRTVLMQRFKSPSRSVKRLILTENQSSTERLPARKPKPDPEAKVEEEEVVVVVAVVGAEDLRHN